MSRESVAHVLSSTEGDSSAIAERILATGIDVEHLIYDDQFDIWNALGCVLPQRGWKPIVYFMERSELRLSWVPQSATSDQAEHCQVPRIDIGWGHSGNEQISWCPAEDWSLPQNEPLPAEIDTETDFARLVDLISWLDAGIGSLGNQS